MRTAAIIGAGVIGRGWAVAFMASGWRAVLYDKKECVAETAVQDAVGAWNRITKAETPSSGVEQGSIGAASSLEDCVQGAEVIIEAVPERLDRKRSAIRAVESAVSDSTLILSSSSALSPTAIAAQMRAPERFAVAHPFNPMYLIPVVELVPGARTTPRTLQVARSLLESIGRRVVGLNREVEGYVGNRLQAALVNEAMNLLRLGVASAEDIDACVSDCLGLRWAFMGPFETMDTNALGGLAEYAENFGESYVKLGADLGVDQPWPQDQIKTLSAKFASKGRAGRSAKRDMQVAELLKLKRRLATKETAPERGG